MEKYYILTSDTNKYVLIKEVCESKLVDCLHSYKGYSRFDTLEDFYIASSIGELAFFVIKGHILDSSGYSMSKFSTSSLMAMWDIKNGNNQVGGFTGEEVREELRKRGEESYCNE